MRPTIELSKVIVELPQIRNSMVIPESSSDLVYQDRWTKVMPGHIGELPISETQRINERLTRL